LSRTNIFRQDLQSFDGELNRTDKTESEKNKQILSKVDVRVNVLTTNNKNLHQTSPSSALIKNSGFDCVMYLLSHLCPRTRRQARCELLIDEMQ